MENNKHTVEELKEKRSSILDRIRELNAEVNSIDNEILKQNAPDAPEDMIGKFIATPDKKKFCRIEAIGTRIVDEDENIGQIRFNGAGAHIYTDNKYNTLIHSRITFSVYKDVPSSYNDIYKSDEFVEITENEYDVLMMDAFNIILSNKLEADPFI